MKHGYLRLSPFTHLCHLIKHQKPFQKLIHHSPLLNLVTTVSATPYVRATMSTTKDAVVQLQPLLVMLSALHLPAGISGLHGLSGIEVSLPKSATGPPIVFRAIISESTNRNLLLKSFYDFNVRGQVFDGTEYVLSSLTDLGKSRCAFTTTFGRLNGQPPLNDKTAP